MRAAGPGETGFRRLPGVSDHRTEAAIPAWSSSSTQTSDILSPVTWQTGTRLVANDSPRPEPLHGGKRGDTPDNYARHLRNEGPDEEGRP